MKKNADMLNKMLGLSREIIGVRFLYFESEYEQLEVEEYKQKTSYCMMVRSLRLLKQCSPTR